MVLVVGCIGWMSWLVGVGGFSSWLYWLVVRLLVLIGCNCLMYLLVSVVCYWLVVNVGGIGWL